MRNFLILVIVLVALKITGYLSLLISLAVLALIIILVSRLVRNKPLLR